MNRRITSIVVILMSLALSACINDYSGDVGGASAGGDGKVISQINENGRREYIAQCVSCHGAEGNGTPAGPSLVGCATCTSQTVLADEIARTMPTANVNNCSGNCASDTAEYILQAFNDRILNGKTTSLAGVTNSPQATTLRRAMLQLTGRMPTDAELALVNEKGDTGLSQALSSMMNENAFYQSLMEVFNEQLLTDKYLSSNLFEGGINLLDNEDFPNRKWYNTTYAAEKERRIRDCARVVTNDSVAREPLELIHYLAKNGKPHTEFMTADYIMVNWYSQQVYEADLIDTSTDFRKLTKPVCSDSDNTSIVINYDPSDFRPAKIHKDIEFEKGGIPHSGILTSAMFLNRYPTTATNRNRHRAKIVFDYFMDTDILQIQGDRPGDGIGNGKPNPTLLDPACYVCHQVMDPVASAFQHWTDRGQYIVTGTSSRNRWKDSDIEAAGLAGKTLPISGANGYFRNMLQWLGKEIASDPRFVRATVRTLYKGIIGQEPLTAPGEKSSDADKQAFNSQRAILNAIGQAMVADGWNIKTAIKGLIMSPYYRASGVDTSTLNSNSHIGSSQFLSPEQLQKKLNATFGFVWDELRREENRLMLGGIDSDSIIERIREPSGLMIAIQNRMAVEMACRGVPYDFTWHNSKRRLFPHVETTTRPVDEDGNPDQTGIKAIKHNIQHLHWRLTGESLPLNHAEIEASFALFMDVYNQGQQMLNNRRDYNPDPRRLDCRGERDFRDDGRFGSYFSYGPTVNGVPVPPPQQRTRIRDDNNYVIRSWVAVVTYLLSDYRFIYQ